MELNPSFFCNFKFKFDAKNLWIRLVKFMFSKKATKIEGIFTVYLTLCSKCQIDGEDFVFLENTNFKAPQPVGQKPKNL